MKKLTRKELALELRKAYYADSSEPVASLGSPRNERDWLSVAGRMLELTGYEPAPEEPERPGWWGVYLEDWALVDYKKLLASHNARLTAERELAELRGRFERLVGGLNLVCNDRNLVVHHATIRRLLDEAKHGQ